MSRSKLLEEKTLVAMQFQIEIEFLRIPLNTVEDVRNTLHVCPHSCIIWVPFGLTPQNEHGAYHSMNIG